MKKLRTNLHVEEVSEQDIIVIIQDLEQKLDTGHVGNGKCV